MKYLSLTILILFFSCKTIDNSSIKGTWIDSEYETVKVSITENGDKLKLSGFGSEFDLLSENGGDYYFGTISGKNTIKYMQEKEAININGKEYVPLDKSKRKRILGSWKNTSINDTTYEFITDPKIIVCLVSNKKNDETKYYPKLTENGFTFFIGNEPINFIIKEKEGTTQVTDEKGNLYERI